MHTVTVLRRGALRLRGGHPWVFRSDLRDMGGAEPGAIVRVQDERGAFLGCAFHSSSELSLRLLDRGMIEDERAFFGERLRASIVRRAPLLATRDAARLVHGESDGLPGLLVDRFGDGLVIQSLCQAMDQREDMLVGMLVDLCGPRVVALRDDGSTRDHEGLERRKALVRGDDARVTYHEGSLEYRIDLLEDQKTGAYLDQADNHVHAGTLARGRALDLFTYHGGFGLQLALGAERVACVDIGESAAARTAENARANGLSNVEVHCANAFDLVRALEGEKARFDTIVIDPPAFAKRKSALDGARRGYKDLNLRAMRLLAPEGTLVTCSCSGKMTRALFEDMLVDAARDTGRRMVVQERRGAGPDHPVLLGVPETEYLKCFVLRAVD
ncbi:MAG: class I SAM-dependent rRNA methyltransferase [Pseudomonadota bacterium]